MKVFELEGALLDYWVAKAQDLDVRFCVDGSYVIVDKAPYCPSSNWAIGGPIIERDQIFLNPPSEVHVNGGPNAGWHRYDHWRATVSTRTRTLPPKNEMQERMGHGGPGRGAGATALLAAMRAKVASHYGDEVPEVPHG